MAFQRLKKLGVTLGADPIAFNLSNIQPYLYQ